MCILRAHVCLCVNVCDGWICLSCSQKSVWAVDRGRLLVTRPLSLSFPTSKSVIDDKVRLQGPEFPQVYLARRTRLTDKHFAQVVNTRHTEGRVPVGTHTYLVNSRRIGQKGWNDDVVTHPCRIVRSSLSGRWHSCHIFCGGKGCHPLM